MNELFIRFKARAFRKLRSAYVFSYFPFGSEDKIKNLIVSVPDHCYLFTLLGVGHLCKIGRARDRGHLLDGRRRKQEQR